MSKKSRVKGKGADIFFSEDETDQTEQQQSAEQKTKATYYFTQAQLDLSAVGLPVTCLRLSAFSIGRCNAQADEGRQAYRLRGDHF